MTNTQKYILTRTLAFLPILLWLIGTNYYYDPERLLAAESYARGVATIMLSGRTVDNFSQGNDRLVQKYCITNFKEPKDIIVLGSSRTWEITDESHRGKKFFNSSVGSGGLEDYFAIMEMYAERNLLPKTIIMGVDPWIFREDKKEKRWRDFGDHYPKFLSRIGINTIYLPSELMSKLHRYAQFFSPSYFQASLQRSREIKQGSLSVEDYYPSPERYDVIPMKRADGAYVYGQVYRTRTPPEVEKYVKRTITADSVGNLENFYQLDRRYVVRFEKFLDYLKEEKIEVIFFLSPFHPLYFDYLQTREEYPAILESEQYIRDLAKKRGIRIVGAYDPAHTHVKAEDFYDEAHVKLQIIEKMFAE